MSIETKIKKRVLVFGEVLFDVYPDGTKKPGGAPFNFAYHLANLGIDTYLITRVGSDKDGEEIKRIVSECPVKGNFIQTDQEAPTGAVTVKLNDKGVPSFSIDSPSAYDNIDFDEFQVKFKNFDTIFDIIYYGTLARRAQISSDTFMKIAETNRTSTRFCDINLRKPFYNENFVLSTTGITDFLKVSEEELGIIIKKELPEDEQELFEVIENVVKDFGLTKLCLTMGVKGSIFYDGENFFKQNTTDIKVIDTTGAGDAFSSMLCYCLLNNLEADEMLKKCDEFASKVCTIQGAVPEKSKAEQFYADFRIKK